MPRKPHANAVKANALNARHKQWVLSDANRSINREKKLDMAFANSIAKRWKSTVVFTM